MRSWHLLKVEQGHFKTAIDSSQVFRLLSRLQVFGNIILNIFMIQTLCTVMKLVKGSYHRRTGRGGARGATAPPNFGQLGSFWAARENLGKTSFLRRFRGF